MRTVYLATTYWDGSQLSLQSRPGSSSHPKDAAQHEMKSINVAVAQQTSSQRHFEVSITHPDLEGLGSACDAEPAHN